MDLHRGVLVTHRGDHIWLILVKESFSVIEEDISDGYSCMNP